MNRKVLHSIFIVLIVLFSCSKDKDKTKPTVIINAPANLQLVNGNDTVQVLATISDDRNLEQVNVSLRNSNDIPVLSTITKNPHSKNYNLNTFYFFDDIHLPSGQYNLAVSAFDGENTTTEYVQLSFNETPVIRNGAFVLSNTGSNSDVYYLDNSYNGNFYKSIAGDYLGAAVNSYDQLLIHASSGTVSNTTVNATELGSALNAWSIPIINLPPTPFYTGFFQKNRTTFLGKQIGGIQGLNKNGVGSYNAAPIINFHVVDALIHDDILVTVQQTISGGLVKLIPYWMVSGNTVGANASLPSNETVIGMFTRTSNQMVVFTNDASSNGNLILYNPNTAAINSYPLGLGQIDDCVEIANGIYLVAHGGNISRIDVNSSFPFSTPALHIAGAGANNMWYDDLLDELFVANGNMLTIYNSSGNQIGSYTHINPIKEVIFWYNK